MVFAYLSASRAFPCARETEGLQQEGLMDPSDRPTGEAGGPDLARRRFLEAAGAALGMAAGSLARAEPPPSSGDDNSPDAIPMRLLGRTGAKVSALGVGGHHLGDLPTVDEAVRLVHEAIDGGVTFFDNCWEYYNGKTE